MNSLASLCNIISPSLDSSHTFTYEALAVSSGEFAVPPARATVIRQPEVMGLSAAGRVRVLPREDPLVKTLRA